MLSAKHLALLRQHPEILHKELAERSLAEFVKQFWSVLEPDVYYHNWHIDAICEHLEAVSRGEIKRLVINIPPRHSKSTLVAKMWPAWTWIHHPGKRFMSASYAHDLAMRDSLHARRLIESPMYQRWWGDRFDLREDQNTKIRYDNTEGGYRLATSVTGQLTGEGGDIIIVDDPINSRDANSDALREACRVWWDESMSTRLNNPTTGAYVIIMQRLHDQDLTGHVLEKGGWTHLCIPARYEPDAHTAFAGDPRKYLGELLWPERYPEDAMRQLEADLGVYGTAGQLQQRPAPRSGGLFDPMWWGEPVRAVPKTRRPVRGWDLAGSMEKGSAWTAGVKMSKVNGVYFIEDVARFRGTPSQVNQTIGNIAAKDGRATIIDIPQDPGQAGKAQVLYMVQQLAGFIVRYSPETGDKTVRADALSAQAEAGNVKLVKGEWNQRFIDEAAMFPNSDFSDQVDASSRAFHRLNKKRRWIGTGVGGIMTG